MGLDHSKLSYRLWYQRMKTRPLRLPLVEVPWWADWDLALLTAEAGWWLKMAGVLDKFGLVAALLVLLKLDCWVGSHWCLSNRLKL